MALPLESLHASSKTKDQPELTLVAGKAPWEKALPWVVFALSLAVIWAGAAPGVTFHDSGEFALAAKSGGIPHPPGSPTWTLLAWGVTSLFSFADPARVTNLLCGFYGAASLGVLTWLLQNWIGKALPSSQASWPALAGPLVLLGSSAFLEQCFITEQYTLLQLLNLLILVLATKAHERDENGWQMWTGMGLLYGLACGNHPSQIVLGPLFISFVLSAGGARKLRAALAGLGGTLFGLSVYAYNPLRAMTHPIMNWGQPDTWERFLWGLERKQWDSRPFSEAPAGFVEEWMKSYDLVGQIGWAALALALIGLAVMARKSLRPLVWLTLAAVPYAVLLLVGHLRQEGMDNNYIRFYGVIDWHLPIYAFAACLAAFGLAQASEWFQTRAYSLFLGVGLLFLGAMAGSAWGRSSLSGYQDAQVFAQNTLLSTPKDAALFVASDNASHVMAYEMWAGEGRKQRPDVFMGYGYPQDFGIKDEVFHWGPKYREGWLTKGMHNWKYQPLDLPRLSEKDFGRPLVASHFPNAPASATFLLPSGWLWVVKDGPVSDSDVLAAESDWRSAHPELFSGPKPGESVNRLTRAAFSQIHQWRATYFLDRGLFDASRTCWLDALAWEPTSPMLWYGLGVTEHTAGKTKEAKDAYLRSLDLMDTQPGASANLGLILAGEGKLEEAKALLRREVELGGDAKAAAKALAALESGRPDQIPLQKPTKQKLE